MSRLPTLPIDQILPEVVAALGEEKTRVIVVEAPPGAGKTTRLPPAVLNQAWAPRQTLVSEPRRIAARLAALRVAEELGQSVGQLVGYRVRYEDRTSPMTQLIYMTEGVLLRKLLGEPESLAESIIFLDEVHERSADLDTIIALLKVALTKSPQLKLICMSATLHAESLVQYFGNNTLRFVSEGRSFPVTISYASRVDERPLAIQVRSAVKDALKQDGDILVFLPGSAEIRACEEALAQLPNCTVQSLHGDLALSKQAEVISPNAQGQRVVLATNIAESSLTIPGVTTVVDSGLARNAQFDPWSGVSRLETVAISQARAIQRAGRAGRVAEGRALRLYTMGQFSSRPAQDIAELLRADLSDIYLKLLAHEQSGGPTFASLSFLDPPSVSAWSQASNSLAMLGAAQQGTLTSIGLLMSEMSVAPRLSRAIIEGARFGVLGRTCLCAALLAERDIFLGTRNFHHTAYVEGTDSDLEERAERLLQLREGHFDRRLARDLELDLLTARQVENSAKAIYGQAVVTLRAIVNESHKKQDVFAQIEQEDAAFPLAKVFLAGFTDRVAATRGDGREAILQTGLQAILSPHSGVTSPLFLALSMDAPGGRTRKPVVRLAARLDPDWLMEFSSDCITASDEYLFSPERGRVETISRLCWGKVVLDESRTKAAAGEMTQAVLVDALLQKGPQLFDPDDKLSQMQARFKLLVQHRPELLNALEPEDQKWLSNLLEDDQLLRRRVLLRAATYAVTLEQVLETDLALAFLEILPVSLATAIRNDTPTEVRLTGGLSLMIHYEAERPAWIEARLQNFFSMLDTPRICAGRVPLQIHLLAPNHRAVQVTSDLAGFWERHYPELRKQLMRRYPKHLWPEDGRTALPPAPGRIR